MTEIGVIVIGIITISNLVYTIWSFFSLRKLAKDYTTNSENKFLIDHIVHTRSSLNLVYASITIITFVLAFIGYKAVKDITETAKTELLAENKIPIEQLRKNAGEANQLCDSLQTMYSRCNHFSGLIKTAYESINKNPQKLYVVETLDTKKQNYKYSELKPVGGWMIPKLNQVPVVFWQPVGTYDQIPLSATLSATKDNITLDVPTFGGQPVKLLICIKD